MYYVFGEYEGLVEFERKVFVINKEVGDKVREGIFYSNFGRIYYIFG